MSRVLTVTLNPSLDEWVRLPALQVGRLNRATDFARYPGGKGINVSRVLQELGIRSTAVTLLGGVDGRIFLDLLPQGRIDVVAVAVPGATRNNYKILSARPRGFTEINSAGPRVPAGALRQVQQQLQQRAARTRCAVLSGSLPPGVPSTIYRQWIQQLRRRGVPVVLDASGAALRAGLKARPWLIKPNREETEELLGRRLGSLAHVQRAAQALQRGGVAVVIVSLGTGGALLATAEGVWHATPPKVKVDSAVGAGDSLVGGFLAGWLKRRSPMEAFRLGVAAGTATVMTPGTQLCHAKDVARVLRRVLVRRLA